MAQLIKDRSTERRAGTDFSWPVAGGARIYAGAVICLNAGGFAVPATAAAGLKFPTLAVTGADNRSGSDGDIRVEAVRETAGLDAAADVTRAHIGRTVYLADDHTVTADSSGKSAAGTLADIQDGLAWVDLGR